MKAEVAIHEPRPYELTQAQVNIIANTEFVPADKRGKNDLIWASIFKGRSIGIDDFSAINEIHIVNGKPGLSAALAAAVARRRGHIIDGELNATSATAHGIRADNGAEMSVTFTMEDAKAAELASKKVWKQYPQSMLWARAVTQLCRALFSDCFVGGVYTPEELGADFAVDEDVIEHQPAPFDSGELPDRPEVDGLAGPADEPTDESVSSPGSASPWAQLTKLAKENGIDKQNVLEGLRERFPGRVWSDLDEDDCAVLWDHLMTRVEA